MFSQQARRFFGENAGNQMCVSPLVRLEVLAKPQRDNNVSLVGDYEDFLAALEFLSINDEIFNCALHLRAHQRLKTPDALQLAAAQFHGCGEFWTNDDRLKNAAGAMAVNVFADGIANSVRLQERGNAGRTWDNEPFPNPHT